ncbi:MAG: thioesterase [Myxococcales bacterium]|nr:MAG: thioesterase [Myxococcales bacterium]
MSDGFRRVFHAGWGTMDFNAHMANRAYLDMAADARMMFFEANGFSMREFERLGVGPVVRRDELDYFREVRLLEPVTVELLLAGLSPDASRMKLRNIFYRPDGEKAAVLTSFGGWLDLRERHLIAPPERLRDVLASTPRTEDFETLPAVNR